MQNSHSGTEIDKFVDRVPAKAGVHPDSVKNSAERLSDLQENQDAYRRWLKDNHGLISLNFDRGSYFAEYNVLSKSDYDV